MIEYLQNLINSNKSTVVAKYEAIEQKDSTFQSEAQLEKEFIEILINQGYKKVEIKESKSLKDNLRIQLKKLNDVKFSDKEWEEIYSSEIANNNGVAQKSAKIQGEKGEDYKITFCFENGEKKNLKLFDRVNIQKNTLQVINQYEAVGSYKNRYDVSILVNGLPLVHIELKRRGVAIKEAFNQIQRYKRESFGADDGLFEFVQIFVISNGTNTKYYSNTIENKKGNFEFTNFWADSKNRNISDLMGFARTFFARHTILNILGFYCVFTQDKKLLVMRPYQIMAVEKIIQKIAISHNTKRYDKKKSGGYVWHTTGSGKTLTSFKAAQIITKMDFISKVLFVVDRKDLDYQTMSEYDRFEKNSANSNTSTEILSRQLGDPTARIIITTIQKLDKFVKNHKKQGHRIFDEEVVIIFDECHRSQFGDMHKSITNAFKKHYLFGFTGTPIFDENNNSGIAQKTTDNLFGDRLHTYTLVDAIKDGNVLKFNVFYHSDGSGENIKQILLNEQRISKVAEYIVDKFSQYTKGAFNSILACDNIEAVKKYYQSFKQIEHRLKIAAIYSFAPNEELETLGDENNESIEGLDKSSKEFLQGVIDDYNRAFGTSFGVDSGKFQNYYKDLSLRMKNKEIDILIVANMFLTGFDAPTLNTLWVDKNLQYHGLIQSFSRTNRIYNDVKSFGNIVCFRDLEANLNDALALFGNSETRSIVILKPYDEYLNEYKKLVEKLKREFKLGDEISSEQKQKDFIELFGEIMKIRNVLDCFDDFASDEVMSERELQDYQSMYVDLYKKRRRGQKPQDLDDDIVFEIELIKQREITIDYILSLIAEYAKNQSEEKLGDIKSKIDSSLSLSDKKDLILGFIESVNRESDVVAEFERFIHERRKIEFDDLIKKHNLKEKEAYEFVKRAFEYGAMDFKGIDFPKILQNSGGFFSKDLDNNREAKKQKVALALNEFFDRFYSVSSKEF